MLHNRHTVPGGMPQLGHSAPGGMAHPRTGSPGVAAYLGCLNAGPIAPFRRLRWPHRVSAPSTAQARLLAGPDASHPRQDSLVQAR